MHNNYPKGSNWLKCDLHVHTPLSIIQGYGGDHDKVWEKYITDLESLPSEYKIIGINDYLLLDGYKKVLTYKHAGRLSNIKLILPVLEYRLSIFGGHKDLNKINFHVVFANDELLSLSNLERDFTQKLVIQKKFDPKHEWQRSISSISELEEFGQLYRDTSPPTKIGSESNLELGFNHLTYDYKSIMDLLNNPIFNNQGNPLYFTAIGRSEWESMRWIQAGADKKEIINSVDFVFASSQNMKQYSDGKAKLIENGVNSKLLHFSDAHYFSHDTTNTNMKIGNSFTWMKSNPTFEGIRQLLYVFDERVLVTDSAIETKKPYNIIDKVRFIDNTGRSLFQPDFIEINDNLSTIVGGKSTGKSLLLNHIAKAIDYKEVKSRNPRIIKYNHEADPNFDFEVKWKDGEIDTLSQSHDSGRKIVYISQSYIDELTNDSLTNRMKLNSFIQEIILQEEIAKNQFDDFKDKLSAELDLLNSEVFRIFQEVEAAKQKRIEIKDIGDQIGVQNFIKSLKDEIGKLSSVGLNPAEKIEYEKLINNQKKILTATEHLNQDKNNINTLHNFLYDNYSNAITEKLNTKNSLLTKDVKEKFLKEYNFVDEALEKLIIARDKLISEIDEKIKGQSTLLIEIERNLEPLSNKSSKALELKAKMEVLKEEEAKLLVIKSHAIDLAKIENNIAERKVNIFTSYEKIHQLHIDISALLKKYTKVNDELSIDIQVKFKDDIFNNTLFQNKINKPSLKREFPRMVDANDSFSFKYVKNDHLSNVKRLFTKLLDDKITLNQGGNKQQIAKLLFDNYFYLNYLITYQRDNLDEMSPGKKNLVILKLLIELSNNEYPILIDQPEDDLDNRSIYQDLVSFLKSKKVTRQIIIVTHNPNVVVGADSEEVIIANQDGQTQGRDNFQFRFEYIGGGIENTFFDLSKKGILYKKGIKEHVCDILEGGTIAFKEREKRYSFIDE